MLVCRALLLVCRARSSVFRESERDYINEGLVAAIFNAQLYTTLISIVGTLSCLCMALLRVRRALLRLYRPLWSVCRALLENWINVRICTALMSVLIELI